MWRPERTVRGPEVAREADIDMLNRVFSDAFTDRYHRDGLQGVRVPPLAPDIWRYAFGVGGAGAMLWREASGHVVAFNMVHRSGIEGWMGPLAVRPDRQGAGLGRMIVQAGVEWLLTEGASVVGLETMPRTVDNIGFYSRLGFVPGPLTVTLARELGTVRGAPAESLGGPDADARLRECQALCAALVPGLDFTRELERTLALQLGDATLVRRDGVLAGFALWHTAPLALGRASDELRILKLVALDLETMDALLAGAERAAAARRLRRVSVRCQSGYADAYALLTDRDYRVHWTDLRMWLRTHPERVPARGIVFSNWEV